MENDRLPYISVIITAYNRKEFLLKAITSAVNQTLDKKYYEIIVIKNFTDQNIDEFINENNIKHIIMEGTMGEFLNKGITEANGEIISFLDDDDLFLENKLDVVYKKFKKDNNVVYYHNLCVPININGKLVSINNMHIAPYANKSSISIKKCIVKINKTNNITAADDPLVYLYALESNKKIIKGKEKLTYYMLHDSASTIVSNNFEEYRKIVITQLDLHLNNYISFNNLFHSRKAINFLNSRITDTQIYMYTFGANQIPNKLVNYILNSSDSLEYRAKLSLAYILIKVYPKSRTYIRNKIWNNHKKLVNEVI